MKYVIKLVIVTVCLFLVPIRVFAVGTDSYYLEEIGISIRIPSDYIVIAKDIEFQENFDLNAIGLDEDTIRSLMENNHVYLHAWDEEATFNLFISMDDESSIDNFKFLNDTDLLDIASGLEAKFEEEGMPWQGIEIYQNQYTKFLKTNIILPQDVSDSYFLDYETIYDNKKINITLQSNYGEVVDAKEAVLKEIVDSIEFDEDLAASDEQVSSEGIIYTDTVTGLSFMIPAGWSEKPLDPERDLFNAKFAPDAALHASLAYESTDAWSQMSSSDKRSLGIFNRESLNTKALTGDDLVDIFDIPVNDISLVTYADREYYKVDLGGFDSSIVIVDLIGLDNGYMYSFLFFDDPNGVYYSDFEEILNSVKYPETNTDSVAISSDSGKKSTSSSEIPSGDRAVHSESGLSSSYSNQENNTSFMMGYKIGYWIALLFISIFFTGLIQFMPICIYHLIKKSALPQKKAARTTAIAAVVVLAILTLLTVFDKEIFFASFIAVSFWGVIGYKVLTRTPKSKSGGQNPSVQTIPEKQGIEVTSVMETDKISDIEIVPYTNDQIKICEEYCYYCMEKRENGRYCWYCGREMEIDVPSHHLSAGALLNNRYVVGAALGEGGFGITYIGRDIMLDMRIAIKEYFPKGFVSRGNVMTQYTVETLSGQDNKTFFQGGVQKFLDEARVLAMFSGYPGVVNVRDFFRENNTAYIIMEYLDGITLKEYLKQRGTLTVDETLNLLMPVMYTLKEIHKHGKIHRDISPDNIMLTDSGAKLLDFGSARNAQSEQSLSVMLKPGYAPEEQYRSRGNQGAWTDVYAMCATIYKCITGITIEESLQRAYQDELRSPSEMGVRISREAEYALMRGLAVFQKDRIQDMDQLIMELSGEGKHTLKL